MEQNFFNENVFKAFFSLFRVTNQLKNLQKITVHITVSDIGLFFYTGFINDLSLRGTVYHDF